MFTRKDIAQEMFGDDNCVEWYYCKICGARLAKIQKHVDWHNEMIQTLINVMNVRL